MIGVILFIIATILFWILSPLFIIYALFKASNLSVYFRNVALSIDQLGNTMGAPMMNNLLILFIIATILFWILSPLFIIYALFKASNLSVYFRNVPLSIDQLVS